MEKGIKILEEFINNDFQKDKLERNEKGGFKIGTIYKTTELNPALENLIKRYKELEKENAEIKNNYINPSKARISYYDTKKGTEVVIEGFIPKSKIKEKIKEIQLPNIIVGGRRNCKTLEYGKKLGKLEVLQELMEDK